MARTDRGQGLGASCRAAAAGRPAGPRRGFLHFVRARLCLAEQAAEPALEHAREAQRIGQEQGDPDLQALGLILGGEARLVLGQTNEGLAAIDEAGAAVLAHGLSSWVGGLVYCGVIYCCMARADWQRAAQWTSQFTRWCEGRGADAYPGLCRMHRAEVLAVRGQLDQAEAEIRQTLEVFQRHAPWAEGDGCSVLGEILMARGNFTGSREAFTQAHQLGWDAHFHLALLRYAEGDAAGSEALLTQALASEVWSCRLQRGRAMVYYVIVAAAAGHLDKARAALARLEARPELVATSALQALLARARGEVLAAEGRPAEAVAELRNSVQQFLAIEAPLAAAQSRCRLADVLAVVGDSEGATIELRTAVTVFEQARAEGLLRHCEKLRRAITAAGRSRRAAGAREN